MREVRGQQTAGLGEETQADALSFDAPAPQTTFAETGEIPPVLDGDVEAQPTASDRAYGFGFGGIGFGGISTKKPPAAQQSITKDDTLAIQAARKDAEALLTARGMDASKLAGQALELLVTLPDGQRGKVIDSLGAKAFENLLFRTNDHDRERFSRLVTVSTIPDRKLRLWAEAHKAQATNNVERHKGNIGAPIPTYEWEDEGETGVALDQEEEAEIRKGLTKDQLRDRKRHMRRDKAAQTTQGEVDTEVKALQDKALTMQDVNDLIERKELEYKIELENNLNLTSATTRDNGDPVNWETSELENVQRTLSRLPHVQDPDGFAELRRVRSPHFMEKKGGEHIGDRIELTDWGTSESPGFRHGGDDRELVSDDFKDKNGGQVSTLEFVLTHEIGHDVAHEDPKALEAFSKAAGWERVKVDELRADGVPADRIKQLEKWRSNPNEKTIDVSGRTKTYSPIKGSDDFWAIPNTSTPSKDEQTPGHDETVDTWAYARVNPDEHFAEVYAKAVHVPEKLYDEMIARPTEAADDVRGKYEALKRQVDTLAKDARAPDRAVKLANMKALLAGMKTELTQAEATRDRRAQQFAIMRNTVFGTDKAVKLSVSRLQFMNVSADKIQEFKERAETASTPEQVAFLEAEARK